MRTLLTYGSCRTGCDKKKRRYLVLTTRYRLFHHQHIFELWLEEHTIQELNYIRCDDYYIPDIRLPEETRPIDRWGRMHREYLREHNPLLFDTLCLDGTLLTYLVWFERASTERLEVIIEQMKVAEGVTESMKAVNQLAWVGAMNNIRNRAEEIVMIELIYCWHI